MKGDTVRPWSRVAVLLSLAAGACLAIGCSDDSTEPDNKPAPTPGKHIWSMRFGDAIDQSGNALAIDASGNTIIAGNFIGTIDFGGGPLTSSSSQMADIYIAKFGPDGSHIWSKRFGDNEAQYVGGIAADPSGNAIITGVFRGVIDFGGGPLESASVYEDVYVAKFGPGGGHLWSRRFGDGNSQAGSAVTTDPWGNVFLVGEFKGAINFGGNSLINTGDKDIFVAKFTAGGVYRWSKQYGNPYEQYPSDVAADASGNIFVVGPFVGAIDFGGGTLACADLYRDYDTYVAKLDSTGAHVWSDSYGSAGSIQQVRKIAVDASGNAIITGGFSGTVDFGGGTLTSAGYEDIFIAKFGPGGGHLWSRRFGDGRGQLSHALAVDASGNPVIAGLFAGTVDFGGGTLTSADDYYDVFIAKFGPGGGHLWSKRFGDEQRQTAFGIGFDASGNVFAAGEFNGTISFGGQTLTSAGRTDVFVVKLGP